MDTVHAHRPRNVGWTRAAALLYGDWGTSKAYVIGMAFFAMGYGSLPIILAVCGVTALVAYNYVIVCREFPEGGGVYSSARQQNRLLAVVGALLLVADLTVTASLSSWAAMAYLGVPTEALAYAAAGTILVLGYLNIFGPKHCGSVAVLLALPMVAVVVVILLLSLPHLTTAYLQPTHQEFSKNWVSFVGVILALSGVEAIANLTGVMTLDPGATRDKPRVVRTAGKAIFIVALEVVGGTALLGWAMLSLPPEHAQALHDNYERMIRELALLYGQMSIGPWFGVPFSYVTGLIVALLLLSAVNTAIVALIGLLYLLGQDREMPASFTRLNRHGVPWLPVFLATLLPLVVVSISTDLHSLAELYAIGVVGAITVNLGSCVLNRNLPMMWLNRGIMAITALVLAAVELTLAKTKPNALFFIVCILIGGLGLRAFTQRKHAPAPMLAPPAPAGTPPAPPVAAGPAAAAAHAVALGGVKNIMVAARGFTPVVRFAIDEARIRNATLYVLYVRQVAVSMPVGGFGGTEPARWEDDPQAALIIAGALSLARDVQVNVQPLYIVSSDPADTIVDLSDELHVDMLMLGVSHRRSLTQLLSGDVVREVAQRLPSRVQLVIHG